MSRVDLRVPFNQKDQARALGARWDSRRTTWYVPEGVDTAPLKQWIPVVEAPTIRAPSYFLATARRDCWRCKKVTRVMAFVLPVGHEVFTVEDDPAEDHWAVVADPTLLSYVEDLSASVAARLLGRGNHFHIDLSQTTRGFYWMNHCEHCTAKLGDFATHSEPGVGFMPTCSAEAAEIILEAIAEPFSARCGSYTCGLEWFEDAQHRVASQSSTTSRSA